MTDTIKPSHADILGAVARGWCHPQNSAKEMDSDLANAIAGEVQDAIDAAVAQERAEAERLRAALRRILASHDAHDTLHAADGDDIARMVEWAAAEDEARAALGEP